MPKIAQHVQDAQGGPLRPQLLIRTDPNTARANRARAIAGLGSAGFAMSWDEYPFASTVQGGIGASVRKVPLHENLVQGGVIGASYTIQGITPGEQFWVVVIP
ncbi:MAG: NucA/NucB deoxyribonuclease domain-containing protein [Opitutaceae bacterium]